MNEGYCVYCRRARHLHIVGVCGLYRWESTRSRLLLQLLCLTDTSRAVGIGIPMQRDIVVCLEKIKVTSLYNTTVLYTQGHIYNASVNFNIYLQLSRSVDFIFSSCSQHFFWLRHITCFTAGL